MRILIIKTSSLGDIVHTFPALTDAQHYFPNIQFDWVVEEAFQDLPRLHPAVKKTIPIAFRRLRKKWFHKDTREAFAQFLHTLREEKYDVIIDAQGLIKSAWIGPAARGPTYGLNWKSAREPLASIFYRHRVNVNFHQHAVTRMREIFAKILGYSISTQNFAGSSLVIEHKKKTPHKNYIVCLHGTSWLNKRWPLTYWQSLIRSLADKNIEVLIPWGNAEEHEQAIAMRQELPCVHVLPKQTIPELAKLLVNAKAVIAVDTGLAHLAAALGVPCVSLYGPTNPLLTGTVGSHQYHLAADFPCAPCMQRRCTYKGEDKGIFPACFSMITPDRVLAELIKHQLL